MHTITTLVLLISAGETLTFHDWGGWGKKPLSGSMVHLNMPKSFSALSKFLYIHKSVYLLCIYTHMEKMGPLKLDF